MLATSDMSDVPDDEVMISMAAVQSQREVSLGTLDNASLEGGAEPERAKKMGVHRHVGRAGADRNEPGKNMKFS